MWALISELVRITKTLVGARESAIGGTGKLTSPAAAFAGDAGHEDRAVPPWDPEFKADGRAQQRAMTGLPPLARWSA
jgi:hypothetical protein